MHQILVETGRQDASLNPADEEPLQGVGMGGDDLVAPFSDELLVTGEEAADHRQAHPLLERFLHPDQQVDKPLLAEFGLPGFGGRQLLKHARQHLEAVLVATIDAGLRDAGEVGHGLDGDRAQTLAARDVQHRGGDLLIGP